MSKRHTFKMDFERIVPQKSPIGIDSGSLMGNLGGVNIGLSVSCTEHVLVY